MDSNFNQDLKSLRKEFKKFNGLILPRNSVIHSITYETREYKEQLLRHMLQHCKSLEKWLKKDPVVKRKALFGSIKGRCDWGLLGNYDIILFNLEMEEKRESFMNEENKENEGTRIGGNGKETRTEYNGNGTRTKHFEEKYGPETPKYDHLQIRNGIADFQPSLQKLSSALNNFKKRFTTKSLLTFVETSSEVINNQISQNGKNQSNIVQSFSNLHISMNTTNLVIDLFKGVGVPDDQIQAMKAIENKVLLLNIDTLLLSSPFGNHKSTDKCGSIDQFEQESRDENTKTRSLSQRLTPVQWTEIFSIIRQSCYFTGHRIDTCFISVNNEILQLTVDCTGEKLVPIRAKMIGGKKTGLTLQMAFAAFVWARQGKSDKTVFELLVEKIEKSGLGGGGSLNKGQVNEEKQVKGKRPNKEVITEKPFEKKSLVDPFPINKRRKIDKSTQTDQKFNHSHGHNFNHNHSHNLHHNHKYNHEYKKYCFGSHHDKLHISHYGTEKLQIIQATPSKSTILIKLSSSTFSQYFPSIILKHQPNANKKIVLKVYDYNYFYNNLKYSKYYEDGTYQGLFDSCFHSLVTEIKCYKKIWKYNDTVEESQRIRVSILHNYGKLRLISDNGHQELNGFFIVLDYMGDALQKLTGIQYHDAVVQLERMGKIGIQYTDLRGNLRVENEKVVFIGFGDCGCYDHPVSNQRGIEELKQMYFG